MGDARPRVLVIGMGALGRIYSSALSEYLDVRGLARTAQQASTLSRRFGVRRASADQAFSVPCHPRNDDGWRAEAGILLTKSSQTAAAIGEATGLLTESAPVITLQNGLGNREAVAAVLGEARTGWGVSYVSGTSLADDLSELINAGETVWGRTAAGAAELGRVAEALSAGGLPARMVEDASPLAWFKVVQAGAMNVTGALSGLEVGRYWESPEWCGFLTCLVEEGARVAAAEGVPVDAAAVLAGVAGIAARAPRTVPSMLQDVRRQRPTEVEAMTGELVRRAARHSLPAPTLGAALDRMRRLEASW